MVVGIFLQRGEEEDDPPGIQPRRRPPAEPPGLAPRRAGQRRLHDQPRAARRVAKVAGRHVHEQLRPLAPATCTYMNGGGGRAGQHHDLFQNRIPEKASLQFAVRNLELPHSDMAVISL